MSTEPEINTPFMKRDDYPDGRESRWWRDFDAACRDLASIPIEYRGQYTREEPIQVNDHDGGIWRVDDYTRRHLS